MKPSKRDSTPPRPEPETSPPAPSNERSRPTEEPTLEEVLVSFQKSLARTTLAATNAGKADPGFLLGERTLYVIDGLDVELRAGVGLARRSPAEAPDRVLLDFEAPPEARSSIRFRVSSKPISPIPGPEVLLARLDVLGAGVHFRAWMHGGEGAAEVAAALTVHVAASGEPASSASTTLTAGPDGTVTFYVDPASGGVTTSTAEPPKHRHPRGREEAAASTGLPWFVWVTCEANGHELRSDTCVVQAQPEE